MNIKYQILAFFGIVISMGLMSCQSASGNQTGSEYMPDMAHSVAYEANTFGYYYNNRWGTKEELHAMVQPRNPIEGTISRGMTNASPGHVPYYYSDSEEERIRATNEIINNPFPITSKGLETGKRLYNIQCGICHGEKGDGNGYLAREDGGKYPVQPANFLLDEFLTASNGRYYHAIMHGKNVMGSYKDKLSYEERWQVLHYIRSLQAGHTKKEYNATSNTYDTASVPFSNWQKKIQDVVEEVTEEVVIVNEGE